jgi:hypothetical protein
LSPFSPKRLTKTFSHSALLDKDPRLQLNEVSSHDRRTHRCQDCQMEYQKTPNLVYF